MTASSRLLAGLFLFLSFATLAIDFFKPGSFRAIPYTIPDFGIYFTAATLSQKGQNPFDLQAIGREQNLLKPGMPPMPANSGPWAIAAVVPFTVFDFPAARLAWLFLEIAILIGCGDIIWAIYKGPSNQVPFVWLMALFSYASLQVLWLGQLSVFVLLGFVIFARYYRTHPFLAGIGLALLALKPQNQLLVILIGLIWMIHRRQGRIVTGLVAGVGLLTCFVIFSNPLIIHQYLAMFRDDPPSGYLTPVPATVLRLCFGLERFRLNFALLPFGFVWGIIYYWIHRNEWNWIERLPLILLVSYLVSPFGWAYDQIVFLFVYLQVMAWAASQRSASWILAILIHGALSAYYLIMLSRTEELHWIWLAPVWTLAYLVLNHRRKASMNRSDPVREDLIRYV